LNNLMMRSGPYQNASAKTRALGEVGEYSSKKKLRRKKKQKLPKGRGGGRGVRRRCGSGGPDPLRSKGAITGKEKSPQAGTGVEDGQKEDQFPKK